MYFQKKDFLDKRDYPCEVAAWIKDRLQPGDMIYTGNYHQIIYHLTGTQSPTAYIHPSLIWDTENNRALGIDREIEWRKILDQKPRYILLNNKRAKENPLLPALRSEYREIMLFEEALLIFERM